MFSRCCAVFSALLLMSPVAIPNVESTTDEVSLSTFHDWTGTRVRYALPDGSVLSEYVAQTYAGNAMGASLLVSFVPRFGCTAQVSFVFSNLALVSNANVTELVLRVDRESMQFASLLDVDESTVRFTLNADSAIQQHVRELLDTSGRATLSWLGSTAETDDALLETPTGNRGGAVPVRATGLNSVYFSLKGSRMTVRTLEERCLAHAPIPYDVKQE